MATLSEETVREALRHVKDPELDHDIVHLGLVRNIEVEGDHVWVHVVPTSANCPFATEITGRIRQAITPLWGVGTVHVEWGSDE